jgi:uncharacterized protein
MLIDDIKTRLRTAMKDGKTVEKEILRVALGEIQTEEARGGKSTGDELAAQVIRKILKSNRETLEATVDLEQRSALSEEIVILESLLPKNLSVDEIAHALSEVAEAIRSAKSDGQATGVAMKHLKRTSAAVDGRDVAQAVAKLRT